MSYKLSDPAIAQIVQLFQLGILTGTDVSDQMRTLQLVEQDGKLVPAPEFVEIFNENLAKLQEQAESSTGGSWSTADNLEFDEEV